MGVPEANHSEPLLPWGRYHQGRVVLGSRVEAACATPADLAHAATLYKGEKFVVAYRADKKTVCLCFVCVCVCCGLCLSVFGGESCCWLSRVAVTFLAHTLCSLFSLTPHSPLPPCTCCNCHEHMCVHRAVPSARCMSCCGRVRGRQTA